MITVTPAYHFARHDHVSRFPTLAGPPTSTRGDHHREQGSRPGFALNPALRGALQAGTHWRRCGCNIPRPHYRVLQPPVVRREPGSGSATISTRLVQRRSGADSGLWRYTWVHWLGYLFGSRRWWAVIARGSRAVDECRLQPHRDEGRKWLDGHSPVSSLIERTDVTAPGVHCA